MECDSCRYSLQRRGKHKKKQMWKVSKKSNKTSGEQENDPHLRHHQLRTYKRSRRKRQQQHHAWKLFSCSLSIFRSLCIFTLRWTEMVFFFLPVQQELPSWFDPPSTASNKHTHMLGAALRYASACINNENNENFSCQHENFAFALPF